MEVAVDNKTLCYHCGEDCEGDLVRIEEKDFCCTGCRSVYLILSNNSLCEYYDIEKTPGIKLAEFDANKFDFLEEESIKKDLLDFENDTYETATFYLPQIHCYSCLWLLEMLSQLHEGITKSKVNYLKKELSVTYKKDKTTLKDVVLKLTSIGYEPILERSDLKKGKSTNKKTLYQLGIAGFCFGNIMFLSFPEYFSLNEIDTEISSYLNYFSLGFATVLLLFSARGYFKSAWQSLQFKKINLDVPISLGIATIYVSSAFQIITKTGTGYLDSFSGLIFFLLLGKLFQDKTFEQFNFDRDYRSYFPLSVRRKKEGSVFENISINKVSISDRIKIINNEVIPSDSVLMTNKGMIDYSFVTGESLPELVSQGDKIYAGGRVYGDAIELTVTELPSQSYLTKLWDESSKDEQSKISKMSDKIATWFTSIVLLLAFTSGGFWMIQDFSMGIKVFTSILIVACPCALALAIPITYGNALRLLGRHKLYLKNAGLIERLAQITHLIFDKTGTLTVTNKSKVAFVGDPLTNSESQALSSILQNSNHPLSRSVNDFLDVLISLKITEYKEYEGKGIEGVVEGAKIRIGSALWILGDHSGNTNSEVLVEIDGKYRGVFRIENVYREKLKTFFETINSRFKTTLLSGDNDSEKQFLKELTPQTDTFFNQSPHSKKEFVERLQKNGESVMMIGDGLNDAGALICADVGVAISENTSNFTPASDAILEAKDLQNLPQVLSFAKWSIKVVYVCFGISFMYNLVGLFFAVQGKLSPVISAILMPISSVSVLLMSLLLMWIGNQICFVSKRNIN